MRERDVAVQGWLVFLGGSLLLTSRSLETKGVHESRLVFVLAVIGLACAFGHLVGCFLGRKGDEKKGMLFREVVIFDAGILGSVFLMVGELVGTGETDFWRRNVGYAMAVLFATFAAACLGVRGREEEISKKELGMINNLSEISDDLVKEKK